MLGNARAVYLENIFYHSKTHTHIYMLRKEKKNTTEIVHITEQLHLWFFPLLPQFIFLLPILEGHKS